MIVPGEGNDVPGWAIGCTRRWLDSRKVDDWSARVGSVKTKGMHHGLVVTMDPWRNAVVWFSGQIQSRRRPTRELIIEYCAPPWVDFFSRRGVHRIAGEVMLYREHCARLKYPSGTYQETPEQIFALERSRVIRSNEERARLLETIQSTATAPRVRGIAIMGLIELNHISEHDEMNDAVYLVTEADWSGVEHRSCIIDIVDWVHSRVGDVVGTQTIVSGVLQGRLPAECLRRKWVE